MTKFEIKNKLHGLFSRQKSKPNISALCTAPFSTYPRASHLEIQAAIVMSGSPSERRNSQFPFGKFLKQMAAVAAPNFETAEL